MGGLDDHEHFRLEGSVLHCPYDMNAFPPRELRSWCERLLESPESKLTVDLSETGHIASHHLGTLSEAWSRALETGKELLVVISSDLRRVFELSGFDQVFNMVEKDATEKPEP